MINYYFKILARFTRENQFEIMFAWAAYQALHAERSRLENYVEFAIIALAHRPYMHRTRLRFLAMIESISTASVNMRAMGRAAENLQCEVRDFGRAVEESPIKIVPHE